MGLIEGSKELAYVWSLIEGSKELGYVWSLAALFCAPLFPDAERWQFSPLCLPTVMPQPCHRLKPQHHLSMHRNL